VSRPAAGVPDDLSKDRLDLLQAFSQSSLDGKTAAYKKLRWSAWKGNVEGSEARADIALTRGEKAVAVEIALDDRHEVVNVPVDFGEGFGEVWVVSPDLQVMDAAEQRVRRMLDEEANKQVKFMLFSYVARELQGKQKRHTAGAQGAVAATPALSRNKTEPISKAKSGRRYDGSMIHLP